MLFEKVKNSRLRPGVLIVIAAIIGFFFLYPLAKDFLGNVGTSGSKPVIRTEKLITRSQAPDSERLAARKALRLGHRHSRMCQSFIQEKNERRNDMLVEINGKRMPEDKFNAMVEEFFETAEDDDKEALIILGDKKTGSVRVYDGCENKGLLKAFIVNKLTDKEILFGVMEQLYRLEKMETENTIH